MTKWTKRMAALLMAAVMGGCMLPVYAADGTSSVYTLTQEGNTLSMTQQDGELTFWEAPDVVTGQNRLGGTITLKNESDRTVDFVLSSVSLPYGDTAALTYLDAVSVDVSENGQTYYHGSLTHIMDGERAEIRVADVPAGEQRELTVSVSCAYTYSGQVPSYSSLVWSFAPQVSSGDPNAIAPSPLPDTASIDWVLVAEIVGVLALVVVVALIVRAAIHRKNRKR